MKTALALITALTIAAPAVAQEATRALVNIVIAEQQCGLDAPKSLVVALGERSRAETGLDTEQTVTAVYGAANALGIDYALKNNLGAFCRHMASVYGSIR